MFLIAPQWTNCIRLVSPIFYMKEVRNLSSREVHQAIECISRESLERHPELEYQY